MPAAFAALATRAAAQASFDGFAPDSCLVNRYEPGTRLTLHQDRNERDFGAPIV
jgi:alkylated DNA repair protein (DNA oxidative demethylase)